MSRDWQILGEADTEFPVLHRETLDGGMQLMRVVGGEIQLVTYSRKQLAELHSLTAVPCQDTNCACFKAGMLLARENLNA